MFLADVADTLPEIERTLATFPWIALIWTILAFTIVILMEVKADILKQADPEMYPRRRISLIAYSFVIAVINISQMVLWIQLVDSINMLITAFLFARFWMIEKGPKKAAARWMTVAAFSVSLLNIYILYLEAPM